MTTKPLKVLPVSAEQSEQFKNFREKNLSRLIDQAATELEKKFSALCGEFAQKFNSDKWILMKRGNQKLNVYYIHAIAGVMPDLSEFDCAVNYEKDGYGVSSDRWKFADFQGDLPTETEMNRCFNDRLKYFRNNGSILMRNSGYWGMSFRRGKEFCYKYFCENSSYNGRTERHGNYVSGSYMLSIPIFRFNGMDSGKIPAAAAFLFWIQYNLEPLQNQFNDDAGRDAFQELKKFCARYGEFVIGTAAGISLDKDKVLQAALAGTKMDFLPQSTSFIDNQKIEGDEEIIKQFEKNF